MNCPKCNSSIDNESVFCPSCGYKLDGEKKHFLSPEINKEIHDKTEVVSKEIHDKADKLFHRMTYSLFSKVLFFLTLTFIICSVLSLFNFSIGALINFVICGIITLLLIYRLFVTLVNISIIPAEKLNQEYQHINTFFAYGLLMSVSSGFVIAFLSSLQSMKYAELIVQYTVISGILSGFIIMCLLSAILIYLAYASKTRNK